VARLVQPVLQEVSVQRQLPAEKRVQAALEPLAQPGRQLLELVPAAQAQCTQVPAAEAAARSFAALSAAPAEQWASQPLAVSLEMVSEQWARSWAEVLPASEQEEAQQVWAEPALPPAREAC